MADAPSPLTPSPLMLIVSGAEGKHAELVNGVYRRQRGSEPFPAYAKEGSHCLLLKYAVSRKGAGYELHYTAEVPPVVLMKSQVLTQEAFPHAAWFEKTAFYLAHSMQASTSRFKHAPPMRMRPHVRRACVSPHDMPPARGLNLLPINGRDGGFAMGPQSAQPRQSPWALLSKNIESQRAKFVAPQEERLADTANVDFCYERSSQRLHDLRDQTRFAAQKFNGCSVRGWVMPVLVPKNTNPEQVVWCLVWHTLKCIMPPMPLLLPADFSYCNDAHKMRTKVGSCWHVYNTGESMPELRESIQHEREEAARLYQTLLEMTGLPHDSSAGNSAANLRTLQRLMFVGELVAHGANQGKASTHEAAEFVRRYGVQDYCASQYQGSRYRDSRDMQEKHKTYSLDRHPGRHSWERVPREEAALADVRDARSVFGKQGAPVLWEALRAKEVLGSRKVELADADLPALEDAEATHYEFGTVLELAGEYFRATGFDYMLRSKNIVGRTPTPRNVEENRSRNIATWGAAARSVRRIAENRTIPRGGGHPQKTLHAAAADGTRYDYTQHFHLPKVMLVAAIPAEDAAGASRFRTPQVARMCFVERGDALEHSAAPPAKRPRCSAAAPFAEAARWEQVTAANWESFLQRVPPDAEGCVLYAREAGLLVKLKRTSGVQTMARASTVLTHYSSQEIRATFACAGVVMNKNLMFRARPPATLACEGEWEQVAGTVGAVCSGPLHDALAAKVLARAPGASRVTFSTAEWESLRSSQPPTGQTVAVTAHGTTSHFAPRQTCRLERDICFYVVHRFLKAPGERGAAGPAAAGARAIEDATEDVEYVIMCGEGGAYGDVMRRFCQADLAKHVPVSHNFYTHSVRLPRPAAEAHARVGASTDARTHARIDATLVHTPHSAAPQYAPLAPVALRRWGIRNSDGDKHTESREEDVLAV
jgi:hypothetical protein